MNFCSHPVIWIWVSEWNGLVWCAGWRKKSVRKRGMGKRRLWEMLGEWQIPGTVKEECYVQSECPMSVFSTLVPVWEKQAVSWIVGSQAWPGAHVSNLLAGLGTTCPHMKVERRKKGWKGIFGCVGRKSAKKDFERRKKEWVKRIENSVMVRSILANAWMMGLCERKEMLLTKWWWNWCWKMKLCWMLCTELAVAMLRYERCCGDEWVRWGSEWWHRVISELDGWWWERLNDEMCRVFTIYLKCIDEWTNLLAI